jgi:hypothetical protein
LPVRWSTSEQCILAVAQLMHAIAKVSGLSLFDSSDGKCRFRKPAKRVPGKFGQRWYKNVGLGFRTPKSAIEGV